MRICITFLLILFFALPVFSTDGDVRIRLQRRYPACRGTLENYYTGDEFGFYDRFRFLTGPWQLHLLMNKARGEEWIDIFSAGIMWSPPGGVFRSVAAGWLKVNLGSGLVMSFPGQWSDVSELALYKPPGIRERMEPASSAWSCRGDPLTGAGAIIRIDGLNISLLLAHSWKDSIGDGHHRTESEIIGRAAIQETLGAARVSAEEWGVTIAAATEDTGGSGSWTRFGADWNLGFSSFTFTGETAAGVDSSGVSAAFWAGPSQDFDNFRHMLMLLRNPPDFPDARTSPPISRECDIGFCYGFRWGVLRRTTLKAGAGTYFMDNDRLLLASSEAEYRFPWSMKVKAGLRTRTESEEFSWRSWIGNTWQPHERFDIRTKVQFTGWNDSGEDSSETGTGVEVRLRYSPLSSMTLGLGGAAFSTDGYNSRLYASGPTFPGEFGSTALWNRGIQLHLSISAEVGNSLFLRARFLRKIIENVSVLGSGWEETEGDSRTEIGFQLDCAFL